MTSRNPWLRRVRCLAALVAAILFASIAAGAQEAAPSGGPDAEATEQPAPVLLGGDPVLWITTGIGPYSAAVRAERISQRLEDAVHDRSLRDPAVSVGEADGSSELRAGSRLLMVVTAADARSIGASRTSIAQQYARDLEAAIRTERQRYAPEALVRSGLYGLLATVLLVGLVWIIVRVFRRLQAVVGRRLAANAPSLRALQDDILPADRLLKTIFVAIRLLRAFLILLALDVYLTYVLALFPWTRAVSHALLGYVVSPVRTALAAFVGYLPNLLFVIVIAAIVYGAIRLVGLFFRQVAKGRLVFPSFPAEWADPTNKIARVLLLAFGLVVAFPYLPASKSPAFAGVSVFLGVLVSLASSSALSNIMAGIVLTYTGAFRLGDVVKMGDSFGTITSTSLLATHVRTLKNEEITVPNGLVLAGAVVNYTRASKEKGLILHTAVTIGYDAPWQQVHDLLVAAAARTPGIWKTPAPFVWQTALNDFYVTYELNAYTDAPTEPDQMMAAYAALHANIQDAFFAAGVEIMSPHYTSIRDGNTVAIPEALRAPAYQPHAFRVESVASSEAASGR